MNTMKKVYFLKTCSTCVKILKELDLPNDFILHDIKKTPITANELKELHRLAGSYEALFSRRSQVYKKMGLKDQNLTESDFKKYLLEHYTFLSRPVIVYNDQIFIGNSAATVEAAKQAIYK